MVKLILDIKSKFLENYFANVREIPKNWFIINRILFYLVATLVYSLVLVVLFSVVFIVIFVAYPTSSIYTSVKG